MRRARWGILAGTLAALAAVPARADDKATHDAQARFVEGIARVKAGDFEAARLSFAQAYVVLRKPDILWNLALSEEKSGHAVEALAHFKELGRAEAAAEDREKAKKHIDALMAQTGHIEVVAPSGTKIDVDGTAAGVTPLADVVDVMPGKHHVAAGEKATDADVSAGQVAHVSFLVSEVPPVPPAPTPTPAAEAATPPVSPPPEGAAPATPSPDGAVRTIVVLGIGAVAITSGVLGVTFGLQSQSNANTAAGLRDASNTSACSGSMSVQCSQLKDAVDAQNQDATLSNVFYVTGAVLAAGAVATWFLWPKQTRASAGVSPSLAPAGWGPGIIGRF
jgi:hypothetical protein